MNIKSTIFAVSLCIGTFNITQAAVIVVNSGSTEGFTVSNNDLIEGVTGALTSGMLLGDEGTSADLSVLTNGAFGASGSPLDLAETVSVNSAAGSVTVTWQIGSDLEGYDITGVNVFTGWRDSGRDDLNFIARYATVSNPNVFNDIATVSHALNDTNSGAAMITDSNGLIASGVGQVQIVFTDQENGYAGYREVDVFGAVTTVPEPSAVTLLCLASLGMVYRRQRK